MKNLKGGQVGTEDEALKLTALIYLKEALLKEEYERCADLLEKARSFGARTNEIEGVLGLYRQANQPAGKNEAGKGKNRLRLLKE